LIAGARRLVKTHGVGQGALKEIVVSDGQAPQAIGQIPDSMLIQPAEPGNVGLGKHKSFVGPHRPEGHQDDVLGGFEDNPFPRPAFMFQIATEKAVSVSVQELALAAILLLHLVRECLRCPDLTVGMRITAAHHRPSVLEDLDIPDPRDGIQFDRLANPGGHDSDDAFGFHFGQCEIVTRVEAKHPTQPSFAPRFEEIVSEVTAGGRIGP